MTRLLIPPPSTQALTDAAPLAQPLRSRSAASTHEGAGFRDALADANDRAAKREERNEAQGSNDSQPADTEATEVPEDRTAITEEKGEETTSETPPVAQESAERTQTDEEARAIADRPPEPEPEPEAPVEAGVDVARPAEQAPAPGEVNPEPALPDADAQSADGAGTPVESRHQGAPAPSNDAPVASSTDNRAEPGAGERVIAPETPAQPREAAPTETENQRHFRSVNAPTAEDQARESIDVATRFDASIRDRIRNAARVDLAALAAAKLTSPTEAAPAQSVTQSILDRQLAPETGTPRDPGVQAHARREPGFAQQQAPQRPVEQPAAAKPAATASAAIEPARAPIQQGATTPPASPAQASPSAATPSPTGPAFVGAAANLPQAQAQATTRAFDRAITALRSLGADKAATKPKAPPGPGASAPKPGAENGKALLAQVSRGMASILRDQGGSLNIRLRPDTLGELKIHLRVQGGGVEATFKADNAQARDLLESSLSKLKETLETNGVRVDRLRVELDNARTQDAAGPRAEYRGHQGDGSPGFDDPSETGGRDGDSRQNRHGSHDGAHGRAPQHGPGEQDASPTPPDSMAALDAEADRGAAWIGVDTLA